MVHVSRGEEGGVEDEAVVSVATSLGTVNDDLLELAGASDRGGGGVRIARATDALVGITRITVGEVKLGAETFTAGGSGDSVAGTSVGVADHALTASRGAHLRGVLAEAGLDVATTTRVRTSDDITARGLEDGALVGTFVLGAGNPLLNTGEVARGGVGIASGEITEVVSGGGLAVEGTTADTVDSLATAVGVATSDLADTSAGGVGAFTRGRDPHVVAGLGTVAVPDETLVVRDTSVGVDVGVHARSDSAVTRVGVAAVSEAVVTGGGAVVDGGDTTAIDGLVARPSVAEVGGILVLANGDALAICRVALVVVAVAETTAALDGTLIASLLEAVKDDALVGSLVASGGTDGIATELAIRDTVDGAVNTIVTVLGLEALTATAESAAAFTTRLIVSIASTGNNFEIVGSQFSEGITLDDVVGGRCDGLEIFIRDGITDTNGVHNDTSVLGDLGGVVKISTALTALSSGSASLPFGGTFHNGLALAEATREAEVVVDVVSVRAVELGVVVAIGDNDHDLGGLTVRGAGQLIGTSLDTLRDGGESVRGSTTADTGLRGIRDVFRERTVAAGHSVNGRHNVTRVDTSGDVKGIPVISVEGDDRKTDHGTREIKLVREVQEESLLVIKLGGVQRSRTVHNDANVEGLRALAILRSNKGRRGLEGDLIEEDLTTSVKLDPADGAILGKGGSLDMGTNSAVGGVRAVLGATIVTRISIVGNVKGREVFAGKDDLVKVRVVPHHGHTVIEDTSHATTSVTRLENVLVAELQRVTSIKSTLFIVVVELFVGVAETGFEDDLVGLRVP